jgi:predicted MFS family arabinose efflux permease
MLAALGCAFSLSQAFRTVAAILAPPLQREFALSAQSLGIFAGAFHFSFGALQLFMGIGIDLYGVRRTVLAAFPLAVAGSIVAASAQGFAQLVLGQILIGIGCAPAFLVCTVFIARSFEPAGFASISGITMGVGGVGLLATGTPLAWLVELHGWRAGFIALAACSALAWLAIYAAVREPRFEHARPASVVDALASYGPLFRLPHTAGILSLVLVTYAGFLALRGLWLGPLMIDRHHLSLVQSGNVAFAVSLLTMAGPPIFGRLDPGPASRRAWIVGLSLLAAALFAWMAFSRNARVDIAISVAGGLLSGYIVLQYADVRSAYPPAMTGRALAVFTMAMFLGVALEQWLTGVVASLAQARGIEPYTAVLLAIAGLLALGTLAFRLLPQPAGTMSG